MNSFNGLPESQCKQRSVAFFDTFHDAFRDFCVINKQNNNKQISEKMDFSLRKFMGMVHLAFRYARVSTNFVSILFLLQNLRFLRKPRWCGYPPRNYIPDPGTKIPIYSQAVHMWFCRWVTSSQKGNYILFLVGCPGVPPLSLVQKTILNRVVLSHNASKFGKI